MPGSLIASIVEAARAAAAAPRRPTQRGRQMVDIELFFFYQTISIMRDRINLVIDERVQRYGNDLGEIWMRT